jgi:molybdopterin synthase catalytic subunit/molybdopterin converting factor small subunit
MLSLMIQVRVLAFGMLKDSLGAEASEIALRDGSTVADLLAEISRAHPAAPLRGIAVSVNAEYAPAGQVLRQGDEIGLLPPVSGGSAAQPHIAGASEPAIRTELTRDRINTAQLAEAAKRGDDGAVVTFDGIVRNNSRGRRTLHLDYEAYEEMAQRQLRQIAERALADFGVRQVTIVHRLGRLGIGETSVLIVVASAHRAQAFDACRWLIDTLKKTVPIWKKETFADGAVWTDGEPFPAGIGVESANVS